MRRRRTPLKKTIFDRALAIVSPNLAVKRLRNKAILNYIETYQGGSKSRRSLSEWQTSSGDADTDILTDLPTLRERSRDLIRNNSIACGATNTKVTHIVGTGLVLKSRIESETLGLTEEQADQWERKTEQEWKLFCKYCDITNSLNFSEIQALAMRSTLENGDVFILTPEKASSKTPYKLKLQMVEADRVCNEDNISDTETLAGGIQKNKYGKPEFYHILESHPGNLAAIDQKWTKVKAFGAKTNRQNVIHLYHKLRIGQSRGVPDLAPVIETIKQLGRYKDAEVDAAVVSAFFTVFIKSEYDGTGLDAMEPQTEVGGKSSDKDFKMASGAMLDLGPGEDVSFANPARPNQAFDPFVSALTREIGMAIELPYEVLIKHFTASYSAARAALLEAWFFFTMKRKWLSEKLCKPVYELFITEAIASGRIIAPGFLNGDPIIREAYLNCEWIGPARGQIDEAKEVKAAKERMSAGITTLSEETAALTGGDWERNHTQRVKEVKKRREDDLEPEIGVLNEQGTEVVSNTKPDE